MHAGNGWKPVTWEGGRVGSDKTIDGRTQGALPAPLRTAAGALFPPCTHADCEVLASHSPVARARLSESAPLLASSSPLEEMFSPTAGICTFLGGCTACWQFIQIQTVVRARPVSLGARLQEQAPYATGGPTCSWRTG